MLSCERYRNEQNTALLFKCSYLVGEADRDTLVPHKRLPEYPIVPREKTHTGAAVREKPQDAPVKERWGPSFPA